MSDEIVHHGGRNERDVERFAAFDALLERRRQAVLRGNGMLRRALEFRNEIIEHGFETVRTEDDELIGGGIARVSQDDDECDGGGGRNDAMALHDILAFHDLRP